MLHLPAALCHYTVGVATDAIVKVDMVLPIANKKRSREQETEEDGDSLSTSSTVDLRYPEEDDDSDEDDEDSEEEVCSMSVSKPPTEESQSVRWPDKNEWVASWKQSDQRQQFRTWISVFAYFDKNLGHGGYGVVLRNALAQPITASAKFSKTGYCFFYQILMGIKAGVELAEEHGLSNLHAQCNSVVLPAIFKGAGVCCDKECISTCDPESICQRCFTWFSCFEGCDMDSVVPLVLELRRKNLLVELLSGWSTNKAAHYLAKREKKIRRHEVEKNEERPCEIELDDFPQELKDILWRDAFGMSHFIVA